MVEGNPAIYIEERSFAKNGILPFDFAQDRLCFAPTQKLGASFCHQEMTPRAMEDSE